MCKTLPEILYNSALFTYNPRLPAGQRNQPFILRPAQVDLLMAIREALLTGHDLLVDKSRDEGASEIICKLYASWALLYPESTFLVGSRKEEYVDQATQIVGNRVVGSHKTLFHKILYTWATAPLWMRPKLSKMHMHIQYLDNGSTIDGEATNENFGAGDRRTGILLDEFGANEPTVATHIRNRVADVSDCVLYVSTHYYGVGHPYGKLRFSGKIKVVQLPWWRNPVKAQGLYRSPDLDKIEILDADYYARNHAELGPLQGMFKLSELEVSLLGISTVASFVADGSGKYRSPWYDGECKRRDPRDVAQNIDMSPLGAGDMFFDAGILQRIRVDQIKAPVVSGEIHYLLRDGVISYPKFRPLTGDRVSLRWWSDLINGRPNQWHNYVVACDISMGSGQSNSVAAIIDVNDQKEVGTFVTANRTPEQFCDDVIAMCYWIGGQNKMPYLIWESNGPGSIFDSRRRKYSYLNIYVDRPTRNSVQVIPKARKPGWFSTRTTKYEALLDLRTALAEGVRQMQAATALTIADEKTLSELEDFIFYENGDVGLTAAMEESAGAKAAHGDRVIALALGVRGMKHCAKAVDTTALNMLQGNMNIPINRFEAQRKAEKEARRNSPWLLF